MSSRDACAEYFKSQPGFERIFAAMRKKWQSYGRAAGKVTLPDPTPEERTVLERFLGKRQPDGRITFSLPEFEHALGETRFSKVTLKELLEAYFGEELVSNREKKAGEEERLQKFWERLRVFCETSNDQEAGRWLENMRQKKEYGYALLLGEYRKSEKAAEECFCHAACCLTMVMGSKESIRLAVLAAKVTGNPHALDRQTVLGALFTAALCRWLDCPGPQSAEGWKTLYEKAGILVDDLSSQVTAYGIHMETTGGLHPAYEGFIREKEPYVVTLANLSRVQRAWGEQKQIFVVENEMVFSELLEKVRPWPVSLLCTSGQLRTAAYGLLDLLASSDCEFFYAGDMDPEGLCIAQRIWERYPLKVHIWHMTPIDYENALSGEPISDRRMEKLRNITEPTLQETAAAIRKKRMAGYQERLVGGMREDILQTFGQSGKITFSKS